VLLAGAYGIGLLGAPHPPQVHLVNADPAVARVISSARSKVRIWPWSARNWGHLATLLYVHDFYAEADACFARAEALDPKNPRWPYLRGRSMLEQDPEAALPMLHRAAELSFKGPAAPQLKYAEVQLERGRLDEAQRFIDSAVAHGDANDPRAQLAAGRLALAEGRLQEAREHLARAARLRPDVKAAHTLLAMAHERLGDPAAARRELRLAAGCPENALWHDPFLGEALGLRVGKNADLARARDLLEAARKEEAVALLRKVTGAYPEAADAWAKLAAACNRAGDPAAAEAAARAALQRSPDLAEAHNELGSALFAAERYPEAQASFRESIRRRPGAAEVWFNLGLCLARQRDLPGAVAAFREAARLKPDLTTAHARLGEALIQDGRPAAALEPLERAFGLDPDDADLQQLLETAKRLSRQHAP
jgi:tetratricopeptide (TPR) repeat protein